MQYILAILLFIGAVVLIKSRWIHRKQNNKHKFNNIAQDIEQDKYSKEQHEFFKGHNNPYVDYKGKLISFDEHADGIVEEK